PSTPDNTSPRPNQPKPVVIGDLRGGNLGGDSFGGAFPGNERDGGDLDQKPKAPHPGLLVSRSFVGGGGVDSAIGLGAGTLRWEARARFGGKVRGDVMQGRNGSEYAGARVEGVQHRGSSLDPTNGFLAAAFLFLAPTTTDFL
ncbi:hypothetical protein BDK51DRAFT_49012, partial [Blyttiomyces helicus]